MRLMHFDSLSSCPEVVHFVTTRDGGVSSGAYESLNLSVNCGDKLCHVAENRHRLADYLGVPFDLLLFPLQTHSDKVLVVDEAFVQADPLYRHSLLQGIDAMVTNIPGVCLSILTADCVPILLYSAEKNVVAAVHAGWRGTLARTVVNTIEVMQEMFDCHPAELKVCIGPAISVEKYEVGTQVVAQFSEQAFDVDRFSYVDEATGKPHLDLWEANRWLLLGCGVPEQNIECMKLCTYKEETLFFSARRQGTNAGRQASGIMLKEKES